MKVFLPSEFVNSPVINDDVYSGLEYDMVGVGEDKLLTGLVGIDKINDLDGHVGRNGNKGWYIDYDMGDGDSYGLNV